MPPKAGDPLESICNATAIRKASRRVTQFYDAKLEPSGLRSTQLAILNHLLQASQATPISIGELAAKLVLDRSALGHSLRPLVRAGLVRLACSAEDRRSNIVLVTPLGKTKWREARKLWQQAQLAFESSVGKTKAAQLRKMLLGVAQSEHLGA
jgi:DNA-binding MarR family transcriptional regulator